MGRTNKDFQVVVKNVHTFDGKNAADFIVWHEKICIISPQHLRQSRLSDPSWKVAASCDGRRQR